VRGLKREAIALLLISARTVGKPFFTSTCTSSVDVRVIGLRDSSVTIGMGLARCVWRERV
jgi:hypothetical protein